MICQCGGLLIHISTLAEPDAHEVWECLKCGRPRVRVATVLVTTVADWVAELQLE